MLSSSLLQVFWIRQDLFQGTGLWGGSPWRSTWTSAYTLLQIYLMFFTFPVTGESDIFPQIFKNNFSLVRSAHLSPAASSGLKLHQVPSASPAHLPSNLTPCFPSTHLHLSFDCSKYSTLPKCFHFPLSWYLATQLPTPLSKSVSQRSGVPS